MSTPLRILHAHSGNLFGGIETALLALLDAAPGPLEHHFALAFDGELRRRLAARQAAATDVGRVRLSRPWTVWRARRRLRRTIERVRPDVVLVHSVWSLTVFGPAARRQGVPLAAWLHTPPTGDMPLDRLARRQAPDVVIANSGYTAASVPRLFAGVQPAVVHPPVARPRAPGTRKPAPGPDVVLLMVARLERWKGHEVLLQALRGLPGPWACRVVGGPQTDAERHYLEGLHRMTDDLGLRDRVRFLGTRSDVPDLMAAADVFVHPNLEPEAFGIVFVEALYAGLPVVGSAAGGPLEIVTPETGVLVPPADVLELHGVLTRLVADPDLRNRLGAGGPARARELADPHRQAARLRDALTGALR